MEDPRRTLGEDLLDRIRRRILDAAPQTGEPGSDPASGSGVAPRARLDRREFLATSAGGVAASLIPGCHSSSDGSPPGLTLGDPDAAGAATGLRVGTELFQESVYAQPVVASNAVGSHALIEGVRQRLRVQSDLASESPDETAFLDGGYHHGLPELIQIERDPTTDEPLVVHYHHPWGPRSDGARTDGLVRRVLLTTADGLVNPTRIIAVTGSHANQFNPCCSETGAFSTIGYMVFVEDVDGTSVGKLLLGYGTANLEDAAEGGEATPYPIEWASASIDQHLLGGKSTALNYTGADKLTAAAWVSPAQEAAPTYQAVQHVEHVALYMTEAAQPAVVVLTLRDGVGGVPDLIVSSVELPSAASDLRLVHVDWDPQQSGTQLESLCLVTSKPDPSGGVQYTAYGLTSPTHQAETPYDIGSVTVYFFGIWGQWNEASIDFSESATQGGTFELDYTRIRDVHTLHTTLHDGTAYHVKLCNVAGRGPCLLTIGRGSDYFLGGHFPLQLPDDAGLGTVTALSGGTSRFGGYRYVVSDAEGNVFLLRQRRDASIDTPYAPPIYGVNTGTGVPRTTWTSTPDPLPAGTSISSNLEDLALWVAVSTHATQLPVYNFLLDAALAFGTDETNVCQGTWLGNTYVAAYALKHMSSDSEHVAITQAQSAGSGELEYRALAVFKNPVDKTWRQRQIATQVLPQGTGLQESGDHYQATVTPINDGGQPVSLQTSGNSGLQIEVRADSPCTVIDDTHNRYHDVDRYTSFFARPDPTTGKLLLLVKADVFSQVLYVRLVDTTSLQRSTSDGALLMGTTAATTPWIAVNLSQQAQQRMGTSTTSTTECRPEDGIYVSSCTVESSHDQNNWQTKGSFGADSATFGSVASYLNSSGQNLETSSGTLGLAAGEAVDPLYALTLQTSPSEPTGSASTTHFDFRGGALVYSAGASPPAAGQGELGGLFSSISHALHDALHWLQHVTGDVYQELGTDGVKVFDAVDSITVTIAADIMKQVNGVEQELQEVVATVEEYASIVANVIVTIVEHTFIYELIELLIALISLFVHLQDIKDLQGSLKTRFDQLMAGADGNVFPLPPSTATAAAAMNQYLGPSNQLPSALNLPASQLDQVPSEIVKSLIDTVLANPIAAKVQQKIMSALGKLYADSSAALPIVINVDQAIVDDLVADFEEAKEALEEGVVALSVDAITDLIEDLAASISNPGQTLQVLQASLDDVLRDVVTDVLEPAYQFIDEVAHQTPAAIQGLVDQDPYVSVNLTEIADLCGLLQLGTAATGPDTKRTLSGSDAIFFPMAVTLWVAVYEAEKKSIRSVDDLANSLGASAGELGATTTQRWNVGRLAVDAVMQELIAFAWITGATSQQQVPMATCAASWFSFTRWLNETIYAAQAPASSSPEYARAWDSINLITRLMTSFFAACVSVPGSEYNVGGGWAVGEPRTTDLLQAMNTLLAAVSIGVDTSAVAQDSNASGAEIAGVVGQDIQRLQIFAITVFNMFSAELDEFGEFFAAVVLGTPGGFGVQITALES